MVKVLEKGILPTFDMLMELKANKKIVAGGLPIGSRKFYLIVEAGSHDEIDRMLRDIPAWVFICTENCPRICIENCPTLRA